MEKEKVGVVGMRDMRSTATRQLTAEEKDAIFKNILAKNPDAQRDVFEKAMESIVVPASSEPLQNAEIVQVPSTALAKVSDTSQDSSQDWKRNKRTATLIDVTKGKVGECVKLPDGTVYTKDAKGRLRLVTK